MSEKYSHIPEFEKIMEYLNGNSRYSVSEVKMFPSIFDDSEYAKVIFKDKKLALDMTIVSKYNVDSSGKYEKISLYISRNGKSKIIYIVDGAMTIYLLKYIRITEDDKVICEESEL